MRRRYVNADNYVTNYVLTFNNNDTFSADIKWINELEPFVVLSLRNDRRLSEINARGLWHAIHFNLRSVSFMPEIMTMYSKRCCLLLLVAPDRVSPFCM